MVKFYPPHTQKNLSVCVLHKRTRALLWFIPTLELEVKELIVDWVPIVFGIAIVAFFISGYSTLKEIISILEVEYKIQKSSRET